MLRDHQAMIALSSPNHRLVMAKEVYSVPSMMANVGDAKRFIDDGSGFFLGNGQQFDEYLAEVNRRISQHGLYIDESSYKTNNEFTNFLDIQFCFDEDGELQTDLYRK